MYEETTDPGAGYDDPSGVDAGDYQAYDSGMIDMPSPAEIAGDMTEIAGSYPPPAGMDPTLFDPAAPGPTLPTTLFYPDAPGATMDPNLFIPTAPGPTLEPGWFDPNVPGPTLSPYLFDPNMPGPTMNPALFDPSMPGVTLEPGLFDPSVPGATTDPYASMPPDLQQMFQETNQILSESQAMIDDVEAQPGGTAVPEIGPSMQSFLDGLNRNMEDTARIPELTELAAQGDAEAQAELDQINQSAQAQINMLQGDVASQTTGNEVAQDQQDLQTSNQVHQEIIDSNQAIIEARSVESATEDVLDDPI